MVTKFGVAVLIFGDIQPQNMYKTTVFAPQGDTIHVLTCHLARRRGPKIPSACAVNKRPAGDALPSR